ncbi:hypothetical protein [Tsuneonella sp. SYSU-LHT278]|uniref:hypothetical protein n=1 Tax=Tsuneonella sediminis TaxID=3416089 RepID=UPI003F7A432A
MKARTNLIRFPVQPLRAIFLKRVPGEGDLWQGFFVGDNWTTGFRTPPGTRWLVRDALLSVDVRNGLPIVEEYEIGPQRRYGRPSGDWPGGHAA